MADPDEWDQESGQLGAEDTLDDRGVTDPLDEGFSPAERPWIGDGWGVTAREETGHEPLDGRLARELPDGFDDGDTAGDGLGDASDTDGELWDDEVGDARAGRLLARDQDGADHEPWASDIGVDGAGASAEEAAIHIVGDRQPDG